MGNFVKGFRGKLENFIDINQPFEVYMETKGNAVYDTCCFGVDANNCLSDDRYMIFYNQMSSPKGEIVCEGTGEKSRYTINLLDLPSAVQKLSFTVSIDGNGTMGQIQSHKIQIIQNGTVCMELNLSGGDFHLEKAIIGVEIYMKTVWRVALLASGYNGGLADLLKHYGGTEISESAEQVTAPQMEQPQPETLVMPPEPPTQIITAPAQEPEPEMPDMISEIEEVEPPTHIILSEPQEPEPQPEMHEPEPEMPEPEPEMIFTEEDFGTTREKVEVCKGQKFTLRKEEENSLGGIRVSLMWSQPTGFASLFVSKIDLDLECLYELTDGTKGCVQALENKFGSLVSPPYILLDKNSINKSGETIQINGNQLPQIKRMLIFTSLYEGSANWEIAKGILNIKCSNHPELVVNMDDYDPSCKVCAIAMIENQENQGFVVEKLVRYFSTKSNMDKAYHWGLTWRYGEK